MSNIILSGSPANVPSLLNLPPFQEWAPNPPVTDIYYCPGGDPIYSLSFEFKIKDFIGLESTAQCSEFRLHAYQYYGQSPSNWLNPANYTGQGYPNSFTAPIPITGPGLSFNFYPGIHNQNTLNFGVYTFMHYFEVQGKVSNNWTMIGNYTHTLRLNVVQSFLSFSPAQLYFTRLQNSIIPTVRQVSMVGSQWDFYGNVNFVISSQSPNVTIETIETDFGPFQIAHGTGNADIDITCGEFYDNSNFFQYADLHYLFEIRRGDSVVGGVYYTVEILDIGQFNSSPEALQFVAVKNIIEAEPQNITYSCPGTPIVLASPWLIAQLGTALIDNAVSQVVTVRPIPTSGMQPGTYEGFVKLQITVDGELLEREVNVEYILQDFVQSPYLSGNISFTLDRKFLNFFTYNLNTFFDFMLTVRYYDFNSGNNTVVELPYKIPLFNKGATFNIGRIIDRVMARFENLLLISGRQYYPSLITFNVKEIAADNLEVLREFNSGELKFVAGFKPSLGTSKSIMLAIDFAPVRITSQGFTYINMFLAAGSYKLTAKRNSEDAVTIAIINIDSDQVYSHKVIFRDLGAVEGDTLLIRCGETIAASGSGLETIEIFQKFICFPEGENSQMVVWENNYKARSAFELTGSFKYLTDMEGVTHSYQRNLLDFLEKYSSDKIKKLSVNTGWVLKANESIIEDLQESKRAWILRPHQAPLEMVCVAKQMVNEDSEQSLISYDLEFQIISNA